MRALGRKNHPAYHREKKDWISFTGEGREAEEKRGRTDRVCNKPMPGGKRGGAAGGFVKEERR